MGPGRSTTASDATVTLVVPLGVEKTQPCTETTSFTPSPKIESVVKFVKVGGAGGLHRDELVTADHEVLNVTAGNSHNWNHGPDEDWGLRSFVANGVQLSPEQSMLYVSDPNSKWVWSYRVQADGSLANGKPFFRMETADEASASGAAGMAVDGQGLLFVATLLRIQICDQQGRVVAILNQPEPFTEPGSEVALGGPDHQCLHAGGGNKVFRRHIVKRSVQH